MVRILQIVTIMNRAGLESRLMDIYRNINLNEVQFDFYTNRRQKGDYDDEILKMGGRVYYSQPIIAGKEFSKCKEFEEFLLLHKEYNIIHSHVNEWSTLFCKSAKKMSVAVRIAHSRGANKTISLKSIYKNIVRVPIKRYATHWFAVSEEAGIHLFGKKAVKDGRVCILPNAIDTSKFCYNPNVRKKVRNQLSLNDELAIMHVGNLVPVKNHVFILKVFKEIKKNICNAKLYLVGEGEQRKAIEDCLAENDLRDSVFLLGKRDDVFQLLQAADVFLFPSLHEGFPGAVLEAETTGLKCFISNTITQEVVLTENVKRMSIKDSPSKWAANIIKESKYERSDCSMEIKTRGYDIHELAHQMEKFYMNPMIKITEAQSQ